jgi:hypothetical protein
MVSHSDGWHEKGMGQDKPHCAKALFGPLRGNEAPHPLAALTASDERLECGAKL